jgi:HlyD family secretion protein
MNTKVIKIIAGAALVAIAIVVIVLLMRGNNSEQKFKTEKIARGEIIESVNATGTVNAIITVNVGTQVSGTIIKLFADFNSRVRKGQVIALIDPTVFEAQVEQAKANLFAAKASLAKSEVSVKDTRRTFERNRELVKKNLIAQGDLDTAETNYESAKAQVDVSKAQVQQAIAALSMSETNLRYTKIQSPVNGIVVSRSVDVGQTVAASFQTPTIFMIAEDLTKMQIDTNVNEADIGKIKVAQDVVFTVDAYPERNFKGRVSQIRNAPIIVQNVVTYDVVIQVDNSDLKLKPGMTANSSIITNKKSDILRILNSALRFKFTDKTSSKPEGKGSSGQGVWVLEKGTPKRIKITTGITDGIYTELISGNIAEGQEMIIEILSKSKKQSNAPGPGGPPRMF